MVYIYSLLMVLVQKFFKSWWSSSLLLCILCSNFTEVEHHLLQFTPDPLLLSETGINTLCALEEFSVLGYSHLIDKHDHLNCYAHRLRVYIKYQFPCSRDTKNKEPDLPYMCFCMTLIHSSTFIFALYHPQDEGTVIFD